MRALPDFHIEIQRLAAKRRRLTRPQGALRYTAHNKGKSTEDREMA
jgi:hypothetical protein